MEFLLGPQRPTLKQNIWVRYKSENCKFCFKYFCKHFIVLATNDPNYNCLAIAYLSDIGLMYTGAMPFPKTSFKVMSSIDHSGWLHEPK